MIGKTLRQRHNRCSEGFTVTEIVVASAIMMTATAIAMPTLISVIRAEKQLSTQAALELKGRIAFERIARSFRSEFVNLQAVNDSVPELHLTNGLLFQADMDHDGASDSVKGWYVRRQLKETNLWDLVEVTSPLGAPRGQFATQKTICSQVLIPWESPDGAHVFRPFDFNGSDPVLDVGLDGVAGTGDTGENDGVVSEIEIGNYYDGDGVINSTVEIAKVTVIGVGLKLEKNIAPIRGQAHAIIYQGVIFPRNGSR